jgi:methylmalonyl-CoA/ethylmalonyl-CoA epimerase
LTPPGDAATMRPMHHPHVPDRCLPLLRGGISQIALVVEDLEKAVERYWKVFGVGPWQFYSYGKPLLKKMSYRGKPAEYRMRIAMAQVGSLNLELIEMQEGRTVYADFVAKHGFGVHHVGVQVDDADAAIALAKEAGIEMLQDGSGFGCEGDGHFAYLDTEEAIGVMIELREAPRKRYPPEKIYPPEQSA